jgi:hypothetical protein
MDTNKIDISDIIEKAKEDRLRALRAVARQKEIVSQIEALDAEARELSRLTDRRVPEWRIELDKRIEAAINSSLDSNQTTETEK